jgi:archaellum component FlaC
MTPKKFAKLMAFVKELAKDHNGLEEKFEEEVRCVASQFDKLQDRIDKLEQRLEALEGGAVVGNTAPAVSPKASAPQGRQQFACKELD